MKSKNRVMVFFAAIVATVFFVTGSSVMVNAQQTDPKTEKSQPKKKKDKGLMIDWLNDFEDCEDWRARSTCPIGETKIRKIAGKPKPVVNSKPVNEAGKPGEFKAKFTDETGIEHKNDFVLGVRTYFLDRGFDRVEVFPPNEYIIRGKAREIKVWVLGRKFRHTLYVKLRDYRGRIHKIKIGRMDFWGWKEMSVIIPGWLPQSASYAVLDKNLHFVSFFVESDKFEVPGTFYFYLDQFRVVTDLTEFTGDSSIKDTW